jgi:hypothetical protein
MLYYLTKLIISALIIVVVTEVAGRAPALGGLIKSLPIVSLIAILWLWHDTRDAGKIAELSISTLWFVLPSLPFFVLLWVLLKRGIAFPAAFAAALLLMILCYAGTFALLRRSGMQF